MNINQDKSMFLKILRPPTRVANYKRILHFYLPMPSTNFPNFDKILLALINLKCLQWTRNFIFWIMNNAFILKHFPPWTQSPFFPHHTHYWPQKIAVHGINRDLHKHTEPGDLWRHPMGTGPFIKCFLNIGCQHCLNLIIHKNEQKIMFIQG